MQIIVTSILWLLLTPKVFALTPSQAFKKQQAYGSAVNYRHAKEKVDLTILETDIKYSDLSSENIQELDELIKVKKEYGKVFGFKDWKISQKKVLDDKNERTLLLSGKYKNSSHKTVHFLEVYWAGHNNSGQYLLTSQDKEISVDGYKKYLNP